MWMGTTCCLREYGRRPKVEEEEEMSGSWPQDAASLSLLSLMLLLVVMGVERGS